MLQILDLWRGRLGIGNGFSKSQKKFGFWKSITEVYKSQRDYRLHHTMVWPFSSRQSPDEGSTALHTSPNRTSERKSNFQFETSSTSTSATSSALSLKPQQEAIEKPLLLEETEPRFNNGPDRPEIPIKQAVNSITLDSFRFANLVKIPCFRDAGLTGLSALGVLGTIIFIAQKSPSKAANWGVGGFLLGSTVSWEQCRSKRRKELAFAQQARETVAAKERPMMSKTESNISDEQTKNREQISSWWKR